MMRARQFIGINKFSTFCLFMAFFSPSVADECLGYKLRPDVHISTPQWTKQVVQPLKPMNLLHGNVVATLVDNYDITADITSIEDGFCVGLKAVDATIGYSDFMVQIDIRHAPGSCSYDAILSHEDEHIRAYLSIIDDYADDLRSAVYTAADSIMPIFVSDAADIDAAVDKINEYMQSHPDLVMIKKKITAAEEIKNKRVDQNDTGAGLRRCME